MAWPRESVFPKSRVIRRFEDDFLETILPAWQGNISHAAGAVKKNRRAFSEPWESSKKIITTHCSVCL